MIQKILVALDVSKASEAIFQKALQLAKATGAELTLLHVMYAEEEGAPPNLLNAPSSLIDDFLAFQYKWQVFEQTCLQTLQKYAEKVNDTGVNSEIVQKYGEPGRTICDVARDRKSDLIVIGRHGRTGISELILGSVSNYVVHHARCNILVIQPT